MRDLVLIVNGRRHDLWKSVRLIRRLDALAGSFELQTVDDLPLKDINGGEPCQVVVRGARVVTGFVEKGAKPSFTSDYSIGGRDKTCDLVDCSVEPPKEYRRQTLLQLANALAEPFGITVTSSVADAPLDSFKPDPGEKVFQALERAARKRGVLFRTSGLGALVIEPIGVVRAGDDLVEGRNIIDASFVIEQDKLFSDYKVIGEGPAFGEGRVVAAIRDHAVKRHRPLTIVAESPLTKGEATKRAEWERAVRRGRSLKVTVKTAGWFKRTGALWQVNELIRLHSPRLGLENGELLVTAVELGFGEDGTVATLELTHPDAFIPEPTIVTKRKEQGE